MDEMNRMRWDAFVGKAKQFGKAVGEVAGEVVDVSRQKLDEMKKRRELEDCYLTLGKMYYAMLQEGDDNTEAARKKQREQAEIHMVACPHCNRLVPSTAAFCSYCGKAIYPADENK